MEVGTLQVAAVQVVVLGLLYGNLPDSEMGENYESVSAPSNYRHIIFFSLIH